MASFIQQVDAAEKRLLWLDDVDYSAALLAGGTAPWLDATLCAAWRRKAHGLLKSEVAPLPVARVCAAWLDRDPSLRTAMAARSRSNFPLKTLLAHEPLRRHLTDLLTATCSTLPASILALVCPTPRAWVSQAYGWAFGSGCPTPVGEDEVDAATVHCADFLREFAGSGLGCVLLEESADSEPKNADELAWYRSVLNVAAHYRWDMGLRFSGTRFVGEVGAFDFVIAPQPFGAARFGQVLSAQFWSGAAQGMNEAADFRFAQVPLGLTPEAILDRSTVLRQT